MGEIERALRTIEMTGASATSDAGMKKVLAIVPLLARILKKCAIEFKDIPVEDIEKKYIDPERIHIADVPVERDLTNTVDVKSVRRLDTVDNSINEGTIVYDIIFYVNAPGLDDKEIGLYVNIEGQAKNYPGYELETRGIFYAARRFCSQKTTETEKIDYSKLEKVYSIWVCVGDVKNEKAGTITQYSIEKKDIIGHLEQDRSIYDKMTVIMIRVNDRMHSDDTLLTGLKEIFSNETTLDMKLQAFRDMGIEVTDEIRKDVNEMCNYGDYIASINLEKGELKGEMKTYFLLVQDGDISLERAAERKGMNKEAFIDEMKKAGYKVPAMV